MNYIKNLWITQFTSLGMAAITWLIVSAARETPQRAEFPKWMEYRHEDSFDPLSYKTDKPLFIYLFEEGSVPCIEITRDRLNRPGFAESIRKKFSCFAIQSTKVPHWVKKQIRNQQIPMIVLVDPSKELVYACERFQEEIIFNGQFDNFLSACSIQEQAKLFRQTNKCNTHESLARIGEGYAHRDHRKNPGFSPYYYTYKYTLNLEVLEPFSERYVKEWEMMSRPIVKHVTSPLPQPVTR